MCFTQSHVCSVSGGELFDHVFRHQYLSEPETIAYMSQILKGVRHLHVNHVVHLDLKVSLVCVANRAS